MSNEKKELTVVGKPEHVARFTVGDIVQIHIELKGQVFPIEPNGERGTIVALEHKDAEHHFYMPLVQREGSLAMFNPDTLIIVQRADGSPGEVEALEEAERKTKEAKKKMEEEKNKA